MPPTLREIGEDLEALEALLCEVGGDVSDEVADAAIDQWLAELTTARDNKLDRYATLIRSLDYRAEMRRAEASRLSALVRVDLNTVARLKDRLRWFMAEQGERRIQTAYHAFTLADNGGKQGMIVADAELVPDEYVTYETIRVINKDKIRMALEAGQQLSFARLEERGQHVRIT